MGRILLIFTLLFVAACEPTDKVLLDGHIATDITARDAGPRPDGGLFQLLDDAGVDEDAGPPPPDAGVPDAGTDPVCERQPEEMTFFIEAQNIINDVIVVGTVVEINRERLVIYSDEGVERTLHWTLPKQANPPVRGGERIKLIYRPYRMEHVFSSSIMIRDAETDEILFVGDTGLHHARFDPGELQVVALSVSERGCLKFPLRCQELLILDLVVTEDDGKVSKLLFGDKMAFTYQGKPYEIISVNMAELAYLACNVIPSRYRAYLVQRVRQ